jgi:hypothetical protein
VDGSWPFADNNGLNSRAPYRRGNATVCKRLARIVAVPPRRAVASQCIGEEDEAAGVLAEAADHS